MGKFAKYINTHTRENIISDFESLSERQLNNADVLMKLIGKSNNKNVAFLHSIDSYEELTKMSLIDEIRTRNYP